MNIHHKTMAHSPKIRHIKETDIDNVLALHNQIYCDNRRQDHWLWEYKGNYPDFYVFMVIEDDGKIVGSQGMIPIYLQWKKKVHLTGKSENSLLNPKYRGGTWFVDLYDSAIKACKQKGMSCIWGFTPVGKVWRHKLGFSVHDDAMYEAITVMNIKRALGFFTNKKDSVHKKIFAFFTVLGVYLYSIASRFFFRLRTRGSKNEFNLQHTLRSPNGITELFARLEKKTPGLIYINQNEKYLQWRLFNNPIGNYKTFYIYRNSLLEAYAHVNNDEKNVLFLTDFTYVNTKAGIFLMKKIFEESVNSDIGCLYFLGNQKNPLIIDKFHLLRKCGFIRRKSRLSFVVKDIKNMETDHLYDIKNWYLNGLWTEGYTI